LLIISEEKGEMNSGGKSYSIKELENFCGIKAHTIRMWEKRYNILKPDRSDTNIRFYTEEELKKLITISILNRHGIKISHIARMNDEEILHAVMKSTGNEEEPGGFKPGPLIMPALRFNEALFRKSLQAHVHEKGLEQAYIKVFYPLMQKSRTLWLTDSLSKAQEQFIDYEIRSLIITEDQSHNSTLNKETIVIISIAEYNPYGTLLFMKYLLKKRGFDVVYSDAVLTPDEINGIQLIKPFTVLVLNVAPSIPDEELKDLSYSLIKKLKLKKIIITGRNEQVTGLTDSKIEFATTPADMAASADKI
jgi:MerR family transcriptional regulator, light-induced transcriptional regulator